MSKRPLSMIVIGCVYLATGAIGLAYHATEFKPNHASVSEMMEISLVEIIAIVSGLYLLRGSNWARWLAIAWIAFHVVLSAFQSWRQVVMHGLFCAAIAYFLFRPEANRYFGTVRSRPA